MFYETILHKKLDYSNRLFNQPFVKNPIFSYIIYINFNHFFMTTAKSIEELLQDPAKLKGGSTVSTAGDDNQTKPQPKKKRSEESVSDALDRKMTDIKIIEAEQAVAKQAQINNVPYIDLIGFPISPEAISTITRAESEALKVLCFLSLGPEIRFGAVDPLNPKLAELAFQVGERNHAKVQIYQISEHSFSETIKIYDKIPIYKKPVTGVELNAKELEKYQSIGNDFKQLDETLKKTSLTEMVNLIIAASLQAGSSDIHIEAEEKDIKVRFRVDGILHDAATINKESWPAVISRIKLLSKLKLNVTSNPQDGRFTISMPEMLVDVRVSTIPTAYGESVVMRLLKSSIAALQFEQLGVLGVAAKRLGEQVSRPNGMIITTGPTGSGKTTTLYAVLNKLNKEGTKIITLEDPVEYHLKGINQSQIDHSKDYSFADGLRSILRQDPDVVMVGEIRDLETADVAINAALTGHIVISTIHTNSASGAIPRFLAMGVKSFLLAPAINAIMGQRLVRRLCEKCRAEYTPNPDELARVKKTLSEISDTHPDKPQETEMKFFKAVGCPACNGIGYKGRIGIYEIMVMNKEIEAVILSGQVSEYTMQELAVKDGMLTMGQDGIIKALRGITTIEEVYRVAE